MEKTNWERIILTVLACAAGALAASPPPVLVSWVPALAAFGALLVGKEYGKSSVQKREDKARASIPPKPPKSPGAAGLVMLLCLLPMAAAPACAGGLSAILATVPSVTDAVLRIVDAIVSEVEPQLSEADKGKLNEYVTGIKDTAALLKAAADGTRAMTEGEVDAAFAKLQELYELTVSFTRKYGVTYAGDGRMSASPGRLAVPKFEDIK